MKNKVVFLDRDGTLNKDFGYVYKNENLEFLPGVMEGLKKLQDNNYKLIIITNQSGIGRGYYTENQFLEFNNYMLNELRKNKINIDAVYYCKHSPSDNCECRKPKLQLFEQAISDFNVDLDNSFAIGDRDRDVSITKVTNIKGIIIGNGKFKNLLDAANYIVGGGLDENYYDNSMF